jgi:hypothetical protein
MLRGVTILVLALWACSPSSSSATPEGAVREFVDAVRRFHGDDVEAQKLFDMLSERARDNLRARAARYGAASGKQIAPWAMLVPSRFTPYFIPQEYTAQIVGRYALVEVAGVDASQRAQVPCVLENGLWRLDLVLPELPALPQRPGSENEL